MKKIILPLLAAAAVAATGLSLTGCASDKTGRMTTTTTTTDGISEQAPPLPPPPTDTTTTEESK